MKAAKPGADSERGLTSIPNVGPAVAADFVRLGIRTPRALVGRDPYALYDELNRVTGTRQTGDRPRETGSVPGFAATRKTILTGA